MPLALPLPMGDAQSSTDAWMGALVPASMPSSDGISLAGAPAPAVGWSFSDGTASAFSGGLTTGGLYYTADCAAAGYTSVESGVCANISNPAHRSCAFATAAGDCSPCPANAYCPGGARAIPYPGYYTPFESSGVIQPCPAPAIERCTGWNDALGTVLCGQAYKQLSPACSACAVGWYPARDGSCSACPGTSGLGALARAILAFAGAAAAVGSGILLFTFVLAKLLGGTVSGGYTRVVDLLIWSVMLLQVLAQVGRTAAPGLPPLIQSLFQVLAALQFEDVGLPSACWRMYPFTAEVLQCGAALSLVLLLWTLRAWHSDACSRVRSGADTTPKPCTALCSCVCSCSSCGRRCGREGGLGRELERGGDGRSKAQFQAITAARVMRRRFNKAVRCGCCGVLWTGFAHWLPTLICTAASLLYSLLTNTIFKLLHCETETLSLTAYAAVDRTGGAEESTRLLTRAATDASLRAQQFTVSVLASNKAYMCYSGAHAPAAALAWTTLFVFLIGYPLGTLIMLRSQALAVLRVAFTGFKGPAGRPVMPPCLIVGFDGHGALAAARAGNTTCGNASHARDTADAATPATGSAALPPGVPPGLHCLSGVQVADEAASRSFLRRYPLLGRLAWLCCGRERTLRGYALASESSAARVARTVQTRKLVEELRAARVASKVDTRALLDTPAESSTASPGHVTAAASKLRGRSPAVADTVAESRPEVGSSPLARITLGETGKASGRAGLSSASTGPASTGPASTGRRRPAGAAAADTHPFEAEVDSTGQAAAVATISPGLTGVVAGTGVGSRRTKAGKATASPPSLPPLLVAGNLVAAALDSTPAVASDPWMAHWTGSTYRGSTYAARHADFILLAALAAVQVFWQPPVSVQQAANRGVVNVALLAAAVRWIATRSPYKRDEPWKHGIKIGSLLLCALASVLWHVTMANDIRFGSTSTGSSASASLVNVPVATGASSTSGNGEAAESDSFAADRDAMLAAQRGLSLAVFAGCVLLVLVLAGTFAASSISGARLERLQRGASRSRAVKARWSLLNAAAGIVRGRGRGRHSASGAAAVDDGFRGKRSSLIDMSADMNGGGFIPAGNGPAGLVHNPLGRRASGAGASQPDDSASGSRGLPATSPSQATQASPQLEAGNPGGAGRSSVAARNSALGSSVAPAASSSGQSGQRRFIHQMAPTPLATSTPHPSRAGTSRSSAILSGSIDSGSGSGSSAATGTLPGSGAGRVSLTPVTVSNAANRRSRVMLASGRPSDASDLGSARLSVGSASTSGYAFADVDVVVVTDSPLATARIGHGIGIGIGTDPSRHGATSSLSSPAHPRTDHHDDFSSSKAHAPAGFRPASGLASALRKRD